MTSWYPEEEEMIKVLQILMDPNRTPVFVHCQHGADRTGLICAAYRLVICGWTKEEAI
jgi:protein tyrosine/serine phosphatase